MKSASRKIKRQWKCSLGFWVGAALLSAYVLPAQAEGTPVGTTISNTAYGSFENPANLGTPIPLESNTVTITVREIAGISVTAQSPTEAPSGAADPIPGAGQGDGVIGAADVVYFNFRITNIGNHITQFFIPDAPGNVTNGRFNAADYGPIKIVGYSNGINPPTALSIDIPAGGSATGALGAGMPNGGSIPIGGYIDIRVPIKAEPNLAVGSQITVVMGNTSSASSQNEAYTASGEFTTVNNDIYTVDNEDTNDDAAGKPSPEREASGVGAATIGLANLDYGDAPDSAAGTAPGDYETAPGRGPSHVVNNALYLGSRVDAETTAFQDNNGTPKEDDGIQFNNNGTKTPIHDQSFIAGQTYALDITTVGAGNLSAWIDFNRNGSFDDPGEQIFADRALSTGSTSLNVTVPIGAVGGEVYARFRYSSATGLTSTNAAPDGEVEDYKIKLVAANALLKLVKRITSVGGMAIPGVVNDGVPNSGDDSLNWRAGYLVGATNTPAAPNEDVIYTIYFLSDGNAPVNNVKICDFIPDNTTYVPGSLYLSQSELEVPLSDVNDSDAGRIFDRASTPSGSACGSGTNTDGGVLVEIPNPIPNATASGTPTGSYGYIRFTVRID